MTALALGAFVHVVCAVFAIGYALFWVVMATALGREEAADSKRLLGVASAARWPPAGPAAVRFTLPVVGWAILAALVVSGLLLASSYGTSPVALLSGDSPWGGAMTVKVALFAALLVGHAASTLRPTAALAYVNGTVTVAVLLSSAFLRH